MDTVLITGASGGIGGAAALAFAKAGYAVALNYNKNKERAEEIVCEIDRLKGVKGTAAAIQADVSEEEQVKTMFEEAERRFGKGIDVLVNNAGIALWGLYTDTSFKDAKRLFDINYFGTAVCCKYALPYMISKKQGRIINISSVWGVTGASCEAHYSASKAAVTGLTKALAKETAESGITVNCIAPGVINTDMNGNLSGEELNALIGDIPLKRIGEPSEVASLALFLASKNAGYITGQVININGGMYI